MTPAPVPKQKHARFRPETADAILARYEPYARGQSLQPGPWRTEALRLLTEKGLPTPLLEEWKYTNLPPALKDMRLEPAAALVDFQDSKTVRRFEARDETAFYQNLQQEDCDLLTVLNGLFHKEGMVVDVPEGVASGQPFEIHVSGRDGAFYAPALFVRVGKGAKAVIVERQDGAGAYWKNGVSRIVVGEGANVTHLRLLDDGMEAVHTQASMVSVAKDASYNVFTLTTGARLSRNETRAVLEGPGGFFGTGGISLLAGGQHGDSTVRVRHDAPNCRSSQNYRTVLDDQARGVFQGKIHVSRDAQKTDGYQLSKSLLLSEGAEMDTKPELEIYADDVKCSHGATTGRLDAEALFYLRSRGLPLKEARILLIQAFLAEAYEGFGDDTHRTLLDERIAAWLGRP